MSPVERPRSAPVGPDVYLGALVESLPAAVFVLDGMGTITFCTRGAAALVGLSAPSLIGRSVLEFVSAESAWAYAASVALATDYPDVPMGPLRVGFLDVHGDTHDADLWASNRLADPVVGGIVCLVSEQTTASGLAEAVAAVAEGTPVDEVVARVERAMAGHPVVAEATIVVAGETPADPALVRVVEQVGRTGVRELFGDREAIAQLGLASVADHVRALWVEPVPGPAGAPPTALVLWRRRPGNPSPNQLRSIFQGAAIIEIVRRLAVDRASGGAGA